MVCYICNVAVSSEPTFLASSKQKNFQVKECFFFQDGQCLIDYCMLCLQIVLGVGRLGSLSVLMSDTLVSGFTTGAAVLVFTSQVKHVFGIKLPRHSGAFKLIYVSIQDNKYLYLLTTLQY